MGKILAQVREHEEQIRKIYARTTDLAALVDIAIPDEVAAILTENANFDFQIWDPAVVIDLFPPQDTDREFFTTLRRLLDVHRMERKFDTYGGRFSYVGESASLMFEDRPLRLVIRTGNAQDCRVELVEETVTVKRFKVNCDPELANA